MNGVRDPTDYCRTGWPRCLRSAQLNSRGRGLVPPDRLTFACTVKAATRTVYPFDTFPRVFAAAMGQMKRHQAARRPLNAFLGDVYGVARSSAPAAPAARYQNEALKRPSRLCASHASTPTSWHRHRRPADDFYGAEDHCRTPSGQYMLERASHDAMFRHCYAITDRAGGRLLRKRAVLWHPSQRRNARRPVVVILTLAISNLPYYEHSPLRPMAWN